MILDTLPPGTNSTVVTERGNFRAKCIKGRRRERGGKLIDIQCFVTSFAASFTLAMNLEMKVVSLGTSHR